MRKLINLQVLEAKNVICGVNVDYDGDFWRGIACKGAKRAFIIPTHTIIGLFDDGTVRVAGINNLNLLNKPLDTDSPGNPLHHNAFYYNAIIDEVGISEAEAFVRYYLDGFDATRKQIKASKKEIYEKLVESGVKITDEAKDYLFR